MRTRRKRRREKDKYKPYAAVKMKFFHMPDPFGDMPVEARCAALRSAAAKARAVFEAEYPKLGDWFDTYDALYLLSFCAYYFLTAPQGVDQGSGRG